MPGRRRAGRPGGAGEKPVCACPRISGTMVAVVRSATRDSVRRSSAGSPSREPGAEQSRSRSKRNAANFHAGITANNHFSTGTASLCGPGGALLARHARVRVPGPRQGEEPGNFRIQSVRGGEHDRRAQGVRGLHTGKYLKKESHDAMAGQKIRIRLKSYDHEVIDVSARKIVETVTRAGATVVGPEIGRAHV